MHQRSILVFSPEVTRGLSLFSFVALWAVKGCETADAGFCSRRVRKTPYLPSCCSLGGETANADFFMRQVHEKSILFALLPSSLLAVFGPELAFQHMLLTHVALESMYPLLKR